MISGLVPITMAILIGCLCKSRITNREDTGRSFRVHDEPLWHSAGNQFRLAHIFLNLDSEFIFFFLDMVLKSFPSSVTSDRLEVVLLEIMGDLLAQDGPLCVSGAEVNARPDSSVDYLLKHV